MLLGLTWVALSLVAAGFWFLGSERAVTVASHDAVLRPTLSGHAVVTTGPVLPDLRLVTDAPLGVPLGLEVRLGKTDARSTAELLQRYAVIGSSPDGVVTKLETATVDLARDALLRGAAVGAVPVLVWLALGRRRRGELWRGARSRYGVLVLPVTLVLVAGLWQPWQGADETIGASREWIPLQEFLGDDVPVPEELDGVEVRGDVTTAQTRRLVESAVATYDKSRTFYAEAAEEAADLDLHVPAEDETVALMVSDRHDNVGMDAVARAVGDAGGATAVLNGGDDTSTGSTWEAFSLDSLQAAFGDLPRWGVAGNHDNGDFVAAYLAENGWRMLEGQVVDGPAGGLIAGVQDPRASGLGAWRDETGLSFEEVGDRLADAVCESEERVATVLVHDANLGTETLRRGCADLVLGGHLHVEEGPDLVVGDNGEAGYRFTTGTTGGAAYAFALGSKPRREAQVTLVTYREERPVGLQTVSLQTNGRWDVGDYVELDAVVDQLEGEDVTPFPTGPAPTDSGPARGNLSGSLGPSDGTSTGPSSSPSSSPSTSPSTSP